MPQYTIKHINNHSLDQDRINLLEVVLHADQLMNECKTNPLLRNLSVYTADKMIYSLDNSNPTLRITREYNFFPIQNNNNNPSDLYLDDNTSLSLADFHLIKAARDTVTIDVTKLKLEGDDQEWRYLEINPITKFVKYTLNQQKILHRFFGPTIEEYTANMKFLRSARIYVLNPEYIQEHAKDGPFQRSCEVNFVSKTTLTSLPRIITPVSVDVSIGYAMPSQKVVLQKIVPFTN